MASQRDLAGAALLGAATGMRTFTGPAALAARGQLLPGHPARLAVIAAAAGEYLGDKAPIIPPRTSPPSLVGRLAGGAFSGHRLAGPAGAAAGAAGAGVTAVAAYRARRAVGELTRLPDPALGAVEDAVAIAAATLATRPDREQSEPEDQPKVRRIARGIVRGAVAGIAGTAAMTAAQLAVLRISGGPPSRAPERVGRKLARGLFGERVPHRRRDTLNQAMHWLYGTSWGVPFGVTAAAAEQRPPVVLGGAALGLSVWSVGLVHLPALGVAPPAWEQPPAALATDAAFHVIYGVAAAAALRALP